MNHLAHAFLATADPSSLVGNVVADYVKGRADGPYASGIVMHRKIDAFVDSHAALRQGASRLPEEYRRYAGIMLDVLYDHFLTQEWPSLSRVAIRPFAQDVYRILEDHEGDLPEPFRIRVHRMVANRWLESYADFETVDRVLRHLSTRLRRTNPLAEGASVLHDRLPELREGFRMLWPDTVRFARSLDPLAAPASTL